MFTSYKWLIEDLNLKFDIRRGDKNKQFLYVKLSQINGDNLQNLWRETS